MKFAPKTKKLMKEHAARGFKIIVGNDPHKHERKKWQPFYLILLARTNARTHGYCVRTVWAVKSKEAEP